jgi:hypothetical protein
MADGGAPYVYSLPLKDKHMSTFEPQSKTLVPPTDAQNGLASPVASSAKVGDVMLLTMAGTVYGQVTELTESGAIIVEMAPYKISMTT